MKDKAKETVTAAAGEIRHLGDYIRAQRASSDISLRQLSKLAGVSNPYLSQIERGLRKPSAEILQQIAKGLRISAEALYVQAGFLEQRASGAVVDAIMADEALNERQKSVLLEIYASFRKPDAAPEADDLVVSVVTAPGDLEVGAAEPATPTPATPAVARRNRASRKAPPPPPEAPHDPTT
ncbi:MAG TPA: helix-turn-helix transcriptional regulator [Mycobacteriales bacterium]|nr:helix-turn-helix transcriptional regulator [Mycobacteriales bacterium]